MLKGESLFVDAFFAPPPCFSAFRMLLFTTVTLLFHKAPPALYLVIVKFFADTKK